MNRLLPRKPHLEEQCIHRKNRLIIQSNETSPFDRCIHCKNHCITHSYENITDLSPPTRDVAGTHTKVQLTMHPSVLPPRPLPRLLLIMECLQLCRSNRFHADVIPLASSTAAHSLRLLHARFLSPLTFENQNTRGYMPRDVGPLMVTAGCTRLGVRAASREMCRRAFPRLPITLKSALSTIPCYCCRFGRCYRGVRTAAPRDLEYLLPLHVPRVPAVILPPRFFSYCCTSFLAQEDHPSCVQPRLHHRGVPTVVWHSTPPCCTSGGWRLFPTGLPLDLAFEAGLHPNHLIESKALFQYLGL